MTGAQFPAFFAAAPVVTLYDPLAEFLGAAQDGILAYRYADAVRLAGHSCPTVAAAFLMTRRALQALYPETRPERGAIRVEFRDARTAGVTGVIAAVTTLVTGATEDSGFRGIGTQFNRRHLLAFGQSLANGEIRFTRNDTEAAVETGARLDQVGGDARMGSLMRLCVAGAASAEETALFRELWQERVRRLLLDHADDGDVFPVTRC